MSLIKNAGFKPAMFYPYYNTRTPLDIAVGQFLRGTKNEWILDGGAAPTNGVSGRSGYYKSTTVDKFCMDLLEIYPGSEYLKMDTEITSTSKERFKRLDNGRGIDIEERVHLTNKGELSFAEYVALIKKIGEEKLKHAADYTVETPFLDTRTGKPLRILVPTFSSLDSISNLRADTTVEALTAGLETKSNNTIDMRDGAIKTRLMDMFINWAYKYSMCFWVTAHVVQQVDIDPKNPTVKQNQWFKRDEKISSAGKNFLYLPNQSYQIVKPHPLLDSDKNPEYPAPGDDCSSIELQRVEINRIDLKVIRGKNNVTGTVIPFVMSQHLGILSDLSYYEYLKELDKGLKLKSGETGPSGFTMRGYNRVSPLLPDININRRNIRSLCESDYKVNRALEIMFQFAWITRYWNLRAYPFDIPTTLEKFVEGVNQSSRIVIDDILTSRGWWTYDKTEKRPYMSIMDVFELIGEKEPTKKVQVPDDLDSAKVA